MRPPTAVYSCDAAPTEQNPSVSVVMSVYNSSQYLRSALDSILKQSFRNFEIVVVDDGSTDSSPEIIYEYLRNTPQLKIHSQLHAGLVSAANKGCELAKGKYIARLDSDDVAFPERLRLQYEYLESHPEVVLLGGGTECIDHIGNRLFAMRWPGQSQGLANYLLVDCAVAHTTVMFRRLEFLRLGGYRSAYRDSEDYDLFLRMEDAGVVENLPVLLCQYRLHPDQVSSMNYVQQVLSAIAARLATQARRSGKPEPVWMTEPVSKDDLLQRGVSSRRIDQLIDRFRAANAQYRHGFRWSTMPFCEFAPIKHDSTPADRSS